MKKNMLIALFMVFAHSAIISRYIDPDLQFIDQVVIAGTIQFPKNLEYVQTVRMYYAGNKIKPEADQSAKKLTFSIPAHKQTSSFYILICEEHNIIPHKEQEEGNLVKYLKVRHHNPYRVFKAELSVKNPKVAKNGTIEREWHIKEMRLDDEGRIPDYALIVCYNPLLVDALEGHSPIELPTIKIRPDVLACVGSEDLLHLYEIECLLSSIDLDFIHASIKPDVKKNYEKTIVAMITH